MRSDTLSDLSDIADRLIAAYDSATTLQPITASQSDFSVAEAYAVLAEIETRRRRQGWQPVGRKIGFTNRTIWDRYGVWQPMWAHTWAHTVHQAEAGRADLSLSGFVQPRLEPEVVFKLKAPLPVTEDPVTVLESVDWIAAGFEIVQSHFPDWRFTAADCTAAFGLHGALVVGTPLAITEANRADIAAKLPRFTASLSRDGSVVEQGVGANVLDSPALSLAHLARVLSEQPQSPPLAPGETITTGTLTDAWPVKPGEIWSSDYGDLGLEGLRVTFT
ncbi:2-keto-4-pentenoate hydratase [Pelagibius sp.]|uniref:2-keto-4-pentenoate hydratase n=1 Tax=Pelagibius sp. TaxID=1931238 RepID=UPI003BB15F09